MATREAAIEYSNQAWDFLANGRKYLAEGDLHQASEKGWGAASWMAKAVAEANDWDYENHSQFNVVLGQVAQRMKARSPSDANRVYELRSIAHGLHQNFYTRKDLLDSTGIGVNLDNMDELLRLLTPLTQQ